MVDESTAARLEAFRAGLQQKFDRGALTGPAGAYAGRVTLETAILQLLWFADNERARKRSWSQSRGARRDATCRATGNGEFGDNESVTGPESAA